MEVEEDVAEERESFVGEEEEEEEEGEAGEAEEEEEEEDEGGGKMTAGLTTAEGAAPIPFPVLVV